MASRARSRGRRVVLPQSNFRLLKSGVARFDLRDPYHLAVSLPWPAFALALLAAWLAINLGFAGLYTLQPNDIANARPGSYSDAFFFSVETLATVGYGVMAPETLYGHVISSVEIVVGMAFTAIVTGLMFVRFSRPKANILYADDAVVTAHNGCHTLMIRFANARMDIMLNASAQLFVLLAERTKEGGFFRHMYDLKLVQPQLPLFVMPWTIMHVIDESSPLRTYSAAAVEEQNVRLFLTLEARDQALATEIYDLKYYDTDHIRFGMRYAEAVSQSPSGETIADLARISLLEADEAEVPDWAFWAR